MFVQRGETPLQSVFYHCSTRYGPDRYQAGTLHYAAAEGNLEAVHELLRRDGANVYGTVRDGETPLHVAIANGQSEICRALMGVYERDFVAVERCLREKYGWNGGGRFWLRERIPVATTEELCKRAEDLEVAGGFVNFEEKDVGMILLKDTRETVRVAVLRPEDNNRNAVETLYACLRPNGFLTWGYSGVDGKSDTLLQLAVCSGDLQLIQELVQNGADPGQRGNTMITPLMEACKANNITIIKLLLDEYGVDPTTLNRVSETALTFLLQHGDAESLDYVLNKVINYRKEKYQESDTEAFNECFRYDHPSWPEVSIWGMVDDRFKDAVLEPYLERYEYDVSFRAGYHIMLMELITRHRLRKFYQSQIRQKPELLVLTDQEGCNVLHSLMWSDELTFLRELYETRGEQCRMLFEKENGAVICVASVLTHENNEVLRFLFEHHLEYMRNIADKVMDSFFEEDILPPALFDEPLRIWVQFLPEMQERVSELEGKVAQEELEMMQEDDVVW